MISKNRILCMNFLKGAASLLVLFSLYACRLTAQPMDDNMVTTEYIQAGDIVPVTFSESTKRCSDRDYRFIKYPAYFEGALSLALPRGDTKVPFKGYTFESSIDVMVFMLVQKRGSAKIPEPWMKTTDKVEWKFSRYDLKDEIYRRSFRKGTIEIPGHYGQSGGNYGAPHFVVIIPMTEYIAKIKKESGVVTEWPSEEMIKEQTGKRSALWNEFESAPKKDQSLTLPDFSYAGYHMGVEGIATSQNKIFNVTDYGATPDDSNDDRDAIQAAIDAAALNNGGVVFLPKGRYLVCSSMDKREPIEITSSNIVIRGESCTDGGTIIHQIHPFDSGVSPAKPGHYHLGKTVFKVYSKDEEVSLGGKPILADIKSFSQDDVFSITVSNPGSFKVDENIMLYSTSDRLIREMIDPCIPDEKKWTRTLNKPHIAELHKIKSIDGDKLIFHEPIRYNIQKIDNWVVKSFSPIKEIGIEDICFMGNAYTTYKHHRSDIDDSGWSFIKYKGVTDSYIRRCSFINASQTISVTLSSYVSVLNIIVDGNKGHHIPRATWFTSGVFGGLINDRAGYSHGVSLNYGNIGTVFWRAFLQNDEPIDSHSGRPYCTLFDRIDGGSLVGSSGGTRDYPHHLKKMVVWNFKGGVVPEGGDITIYDFWKEGQPDRFVMPIIVGYHGQPAYFNESNLEVLESLGAPVSPESLYEAQLELRMDERPAWIDEVKADYERINNAQLPQFYDKNDADSVPYIHTEIFQLKDELDFITARALRMYGKEFFSYTMNNESFSLKTDRGYVRSIIYGAMNCVYEFSKKSNSIDVVTTQGEGASAVITIKAGCKVDADSAVIEQNIYFQDIAKYCRIMNGSVKLLLDKDGEMEIQVVLPAAL